MTRAFDYTNISLRNAGYEREIVRVANGVEFVVLNLDRAEIETARSVLYMHVHSDTGRCYIGITEQETKSRWTNGVAYKNNRRFGSALKKYGWRQFSSYILAFGDDRESLNRVEIDAIAAAGGHKSPWTFNLSPGGDAVAENDKPIVGLNLETGEEIRFRSGAAAARELGFSNVDKAMAVARRERISAEGWWFRFLDDLESRPPGVWGEKLRVEAVRNLQGKSVVAINLNTNARQIYATVNSAAKALGVEQSQVSAVANRKALSAKGWWFCLLGEQEVPSQLFASQATRAKRDRAVWAVNLKTRERLCFRNCTEASISLGLFKGAAAGVASGARASAGDWWFSYDPSGEPPALTKGALVAAARSIAVFAHHLESGTQHRYDSAKHAAEQLGMSRAAISKCLSGKSASVKGYRFTLSE
jgi:predicted XRE-type DNA-binding protein